jgi:preprotein translocase subunit SecD
MCPPVRRAPASGDSDLPGIAGVVLDRHGGARQPLIFERIRRCCSAKRCARQSTRVSERAGGDHDSNITTLIAALFLFQFGTGPVRGFAVTLSIGILGTLLCAIFFSRWIFDLFYLNRPASQRISI